MGERAKREVNLQSAATLHDEGLPHKAASRVVREGEVNGFVEEFFKVFLVSFVRLTSARNNRDAGLIRYPLCAPFSKCFLQAHGL